MAHLVFTCQAEPTFDLGGHLPAELAEALGVAPSAILTTSNLGTFILKAGVTLTAPTTPEGESPFRVLRRDQLADLPPPAPLVADTLDADSFALLVGVPGSGKSLAALDLAAAIATGRPWHGRAVVPGRVLYVAAGEGHAGLHARLSAWETLNDATIPGDSFNVVPDVVSLTAAPDLAHLTAEVSTGRYRLVVLDNLARVSGAADENSTRDASQLVATLDGLRAASGGACILLVHHTGKADPLSARGSGVFVGAADCVYVAQAPPETDLTTLRRTKAKDRETHDVLDLRRVPVGDSVALRLSTASDPVELADPKDARDKVWRILWTAYANRLTFVRSDALRVVMDETQVSRSSVYAAMNHLIGLDVMRQVGTERAQAWRLDREAAEAAGLTSPTLLDASSASAPDLRDVLPLITTNEME